MNTDQGSQFSSSRFVERLWRSVRNEDVYLRAYETVSAARAGIGRYLTFCNSRRPHTAHGAKAPDMVYFAQLAQLRQTAQAA